MPIRQRLALLVTMAAVAAADAPSVHAGTARTTATCFGVTPGVTTDTNNDFADSVVDPNVSVGVDAMNLSVQYDNTNGDQDGWCEWHVPEDYDNTSATNPYIAVLGWASECVICISGLTCNTDKHVEFDVASRVLVSPYGTTRGYGAVDSVSFTFVSQACGSPCSTNCWQADVMYGPSNADITDDASNFAPGDRVQIRLQRDNDVSNNLGGDFNIPVTLSVVYPTP